MFLSPFSFAIYLFKSQDICFLVSHNVDLADYISLV